MNLTAMHRLFVSASLGIAGSLGAADQAQWGQAWSRNMISSERNLPEIFDPQTGRNIKWSVPLGTETHSSPVIADGRVYIGTNNGEPRDPRHRGDRGVLMCFNEQDGKLLWQLVVPKRSEDPYFDWPDSGISSPATVEGRRVYLVNNRAEVMCLDSGGLSDGNDGPFLSEGLHMSPSTNFAGPPKPVAGADIRPAPPRSPSEGPAMEPGPLDADILWTLDLPSIAGIWPHDGAHSSILIHGDHLYLNTGTGVDNTHKRIRTPDAPSLVVLDKRTGRLLARDEEGIAPDIFHCTWSSPALAEVNGSPLVVFAGGNGVIYAFEPIQASPLLTERVQALNLVWKFDFDPDAPKTNVHRFNGNRRESPSNIYGLPVVHENRVYVAGGGDVFWGKNEAWLKCLDATQTGDVTRTALVWSYALQRHVLSTPALHNGLIFIADCGRTFHCVDATTGKGLWTHDIAGEVWASPLVADGKVYLGTRSGAFYVFAADREKRLISNVNLVTPISATAAAANGVLYVATMNRLFAVHRGPIDSAATGQAVDH